MHQLSGKEWKRRMKQYWALRAWKLMVCMEKNGKTSKNLCYQESKFAVILFGWI